MWIFTKEGFFSVVATSEPDELMVRARVREDLENYIDFMGAVPGPEIIETPHADYRYRIITARDEWAEYVSAAASDLDYTNVKGTIGRGAARHRAMMRVWGAMGNLQDGGPYGTLANFSTD